MTRTFGSSFPKTSDLYTNDCADGGEEDRQGGEYEAKEYHKSSDEIHGPANEGERYIE